MSSKGNLLDSEIPPVDPTPILKSKNIKDHTEKLEIFQKEKIK